MKVFLRNIIWALVSCSLHQAAEVPIQPHLSRWQLAGRWYPISLVMDYEGKVSLAVVGRTVVPMASGNLDVDYETFENGHCILRMSTYRRTNTKGKFVVDSRFILRIVETDYDNYLVFHLEAEGKSSLYLDARWPAASATVKEKFKSIASSLGFPVDKILDVPKYDSCP